MKPSNKAVELLARRLCLVGMDQCTAETISFDEYEKEWRDYTDTASKILNEIYALDFAEEPMAWVQDNRGEFVPVVQHLFKGAAGEITYEWTWPAESKSYSDMGRETIVGAHLSSNPNTGYMPGDVFVNSRRWHEED